MRPASRASRISSRENSLSLIDTTVIGPVLLQPRITGECHPNFAQGCHLYIAVTPVIRVTLYYGTQIGPGLKCSQGFTPSSSAAQVENQSNQPPVGHQDEQAKGTARTCPDRAC